MRAEFNAEGVYADLLDSHRQMQADELAREAQNGAFMTGIAKIDGVHSMNTLEEPTEEMSPQSPGLQIQ